MLHSLRKIIIIFEQIVFTTQRYHTSVKRFHQRAYSQFTWDLISDKSITHQQQLFAQKRCLPKAWDVNTYRHPWNRALGTM